MILDPVIEVNCDNEDCGESVFVELDYVYHDYSGNNGHYDTEDETIERQLQSEHDWVVVDGKHYCCDECAAEGGGMTEGIVNIHGKEYQTVAFRVQTFREKYPEYGLRTTLLDASGEYVVMRAEIWNGDYLLATGHAEEKRGSTQINRTSALENCETSAIGRALAAMGLGGTEFASANEVQNAVRQQKGGNDFISKKQAEQLSAMLKETGADVDAFLTFAKADTMDIIAQRQYPILLAKLEAKQKAQLLKDAAREPGSDDE